MGSITMISLLPEKMADAVTRPPELSEAEYVRAVLKQPPSKTEDEIDQELLARAQKLGIDPAATQPSTSPDKPMSSGAESAVATTPVRHARTGSAASNGSGSTARSAYYVTSSPSAFVDTPPSIITRKRSKSQSLSFSQYEKYLRQVDPNISQPKFLPHSSSAGVPETASIFGENTRRSVKIIKHGITEKLKWRRRSSSIRLPNSMVVSCICCREDFAGSEHHTSLHTLPCGHTYCRSCLSVMITQATTDESMMPPRCCTQPIPGSTIKSILTRDQQQTFLKAVLQYSTPWESRIFCPLPSCGEFIPPRSAAAAAAGSGGGVEPKHDPFEVVCRSCKTRVCVMCRRVAHRPGQDCPDDWELDEVLRMGDRSGWRRCFKCRTLIELSQGCTHMTCRCKAQFCYICGAIWDPLVGCPNFCNGDEELEHRRVEEARRMAAVEARERARAKAAAVEERARAEAEKRTAESGEFRALAERQRAQMGEFRRFEQKMKWIMLTRHSQKRLALIDKYRDQMEKMKERHAKTEQHLEDRQIEAEIELRSALEQSERSIRIQLKYMEAYCHGGGHEREVTAKHLEQLGQQYRLRDGMERRHQSQINVLREKQAKRMEELVGRHEEETAALVERRSEEFEDLGLGFANEEEALVREFGLRRERMVRRWGVEGEMLRVEMEGREGVRFGRMEMPVWPEPGEEEGLPAVREEGGNESDER